MNTNNLLTLDFQHAAIDRRDVLSLLKKLIPTIEQCEQAQKRDYETPYAFIHAPHDEGLLQTITMHAEKYRAKNPTLIVVIGIGGSQLGTQAVAEALLGKNSNAPQLLFADTIDSIYQQKVLARAQQELAAGNTILVNIVTKSGTTTETLVNAALFFELLKKYYGERANEHIVITTDKGSPLWQLAQQQRISVLEVPAQLGGRFSVFSAVGLFPLALLGLPIQELCEGARMMNEICLSHGMLNSAAVSAAVLFLYIQRHSAIYDTFIFSPQLAAFGAWYRQLVGESLGKRYDLQQQLVETGITPTISLGTNDLHSVAQLYLAGPRDKITSFISITNKAPILFVPQNIFSRLLTHKKITIQELKNFILESVQSSYRDEQRPYMHLQLHDISAQSLGQLLQIKMFEVIYLAFLLNIDPFDQPAVESYKKSVHQALNT